jgi:hypothetical protein
MANAAQNVMSMAIEISAPGSKNTPRIIRSDAGYEIWVDGQRRSFRDVKATAYEAAFFLKMVGKGKEKVEILDRSTGQRGEMFADGRVI